MPSSILRVITIDGPSASGKSTTAKEIAHRLGWQYVDTGAMYRALGYAALRAGKNPGTERDVLPILEVAEIELWGNAPVRVMLNGEDVSDQIRSPEVSEAASIISVHPAVRRKLVALQRKLGLEQPSVLEGRDTGTVVFPDAGLKIYLDAGLAERARRRMAEYHLKGIEADLAEVMADLEERDKRDSTRTDGPLKVPDNARIIDTTNLSIEEQVREVLQLAKERFKVLEIE